MSTNQNNVQVEFGQITVDHVAPHKYKKDLAQAQIRQIIIRKYPSTRINNNLQDSIVNKEEFNLPTQDYTEKRVDWVNVPLTFTKEDAERSLANYPNGVIYKYLSSKPIFTDGDLNWAKTIEERDGVEAANEWIEDRATSQLVKTNDGEAINDKNGNAQYSRNFFAREMPENANQFGVIDERIKVKSTGYEMQEETPRVQFAQPETEKQTVKTV